MRLLEIKKKIEELGGGGKIEVPVKQSLGNFYIIEKAGRLTRLLEFLAEQEWNPLEPEKIEALVGEANMLGNDEAMLSTMQYNQLVDYVNELNKQLPIFFGIVDSVATEQSEYTVNIKLSESIQSSKDLGALVSDINKMEKMTDLDGKGLRFTGFDVGSSWMTFVADGSLAYGFIMACTKLAQEVLKLREQYYKTKEARINFKMAQKKNAEFDEKQFTKHCREYCDEYLKDGAREIAEEIGEVNGQTQNEIEGKATKATESLIKIIGDGNEVHVSLNSANGISEGSSGEIEMNYEKLKEISEAYREAVKGLPDGAEEELEEADGDVAEE